MLIDPISHVSTNFNDYKQAEASIKRLKNINQEPVEDDKENLRRISNFEGKISFKKVNFAYEKDNKILKNINLEIKRGEVTAFVGASGAGKSTMLALILKFIAPNNGVIFIDDKNLKILHCVFFPDPKFDIPIFGMDLVKINDIVSAAIVDLSPASQNQGLKYEKLLSEVDKSSFTSLRDIPKWGGIFSNNVFFASLKSKSDKNDFCRVVDQYLTILIKLSKKAKPEVNEEIIQERIDFQKNYCVQQMKNEKTSMVLLKYFDEKWVNNYIKTVLFDF